MMMNYKRWRLAQNRRLFAVRPATGSLVVRAHKTVDMSVFYRDSQRAGRAGSYTTPRVLSRHVRTLCRACVCACVCSYVFVSGHCDDSGSVHTRVLAGPVRRATSSIGDRGNGNGGQREIVDKLGLCGRGMVGGGDADALQCRPPTVACRSFAPSPQDLFYE